jgi:hypothetical protein
LRLRGLPATGSSGHIAEEVALMTHPASGRGDGRGDGRGIGRAPHAHRHRPGLALGLGAGAGLLGGLIGLGGAEFRLPVLVAALRFAPRDAVPINLAASFAVAPGASCPPDRPSST